MRNHTNDAIASVPWRFAVATIAAIALAAGCAEPPKKEVAPEAAAPPAAPVPAAVPQRPPEPELSPAQAKAQSQQLALQAVDQLQNGDEAGARQTLGKALALDPTNDIAKKMNDQIGADAQKELGATFFRYTVQKDDSLSKLAAQYLGDRFRFYILAKYNEIANPSRLGAGQVIKIPGRAPPPGAVPPRTGGDTPDTGTKPAPAEAAAPAAGDLGLLMQKGRQQQAAGNLEGAYATFSEAASRFPGNKDALLQRDAAKTALLRSLDREGMQAFQRQNLDLAITKWDRILELDPANQKAKLERERSLDLKQKMSEKFGAPK